MIVKWRRAWQPTPVFLPGESRGQKSLAGYSPQGHKESDRTERLSTAQLVKWDMKKHKRCDTDGFNFVSFQEP